MKGLSWSVAGAPTRLRVTPYEAGDKGTEPTVPVGFPDWPAGMLRTSIASFMPFLAAAANRGITGNRRILSEGSMAQMLEMRALPGLPSWLTGQGLGWMESAEAGTRHINHWGGDPGVFTAAYLDPRSTMALAAFTNVSPTDSSKAAIKAIAHHVLDDRGGLN